MVKIEMAVQVVQEAPLCLLCRGRGMARWALRPRQEFRTLVHARRPSCWGCGTWDARDDVARVPLAHETSVEIGPARTAGRLVVAWTFPGFAESYLRTLAGREEMP